MWRQGHAKEEAGVEEHRSSRARRRTRSCVVLPPCLPPVAAVTSFTRTRPGLSCYHRSLTALRKILLGKGPWVPFSMCVCGVCSIFHYFSKCSFPKRNASGYQNGYLEGSEEKVWDMIGKKACFSLRQRPPDPQFRWRSFLCANVLTALLPWVEILTAPPSLNAS